MFSVQNSKCPRRFSETDHDCLYTRSTRSYQVVGVFFFFSRNLDLLKPKTPPKTKKRKKTNPHQIETNQTKKGWRRSYVLNSTLWRTHNWQNSQAWKRHSSKTATTKKNSRTARQPVGSRGVVLCRVWHWLLKVTRSNENCYKRSRFAHHSHTHLTRTYRSG